MRQVYVIVMTVTVMVVMVIVVMMVMVMMVRMGDQSLDRRRFRIARLSRLRSLNARRIVAAAGRRR